MRSALLIAAAVVALAGCKEKTGSTTITTNSQTGDVTSSTTGSGATPVKLQPGKWEVKVAVRDLKIPSMPKAPPTPPAMTTTTCITPEQAEKGPGDFLKQAKMDCTATTSSFAGGTISAEMTCKMPGGGAMTSKTTGSYTPTSMTTDAEMSMTGAMAMSQKVHTEARRVGECAAGK